MRNYCIIATVVAIAFAASCAKIELTENQCVEEAQLSTSKAKVKALLAERDTRWTVEDLDVPVVEGEWNVISTDKQLAFLLEFGCVEGKKYRLDSDIDFATSTIKDKLSSEVGIEPFENIEFDGNGKTISGANLPWAAGIFSKAKNAKVYDLTLSGCSVGAAENVSNFLGTGMVFGQVEGTIDVNNVVVTGSSVTAPCQVGGFVGSIVDATASFTDCKVVSSEVLTIDRSGVSGWCGGFAGFVGRSQEMSRETVVSVSMNSCAVEGGRVTAQMNSNTRFCGKFLGTVNGYDYRECVTLTGCTATPEFNLADAVSYTEDDMIGGDKYGMAAVSVDGKAPSVWDGATTKEPGRSTAAYDGVDGAYLVLDAAELAWFQGKTVTDNILIRRDINLGGKTFAPLYKAQYIDGQKANGENACIYGLKVVREKCGKEDGGAFIRQASGTTVHKNFTFRGADIKATHDESADHGNAYCATLCGNMTDTYTMENVHAYDGKLYGVNKMGGLLGRVAATATIKDCSVSGYTIENYKVMDKPETFTGTAEKAGMTVTATATFYPHGEIGGMIGFIHGKTDVSNCQISNTVINATGQADVKATLSGSPIAVGGINLLGGFVVPGRHVSALIGDIRTGKSGAGFAVTISNCTVGSDVNVTPTWDKHSSNAPFIGQCYYIYSVDNSSGSVTVDGNSQSIKHCVSF